ncbi:MAG: MBL fold metallo-hydrolase, partial [Longimicrobiales bacterium]
MLLRQIMDPKLAEYAYLIGCQATREALLIDPQRDIDRYVDAAQAHGLRITAVAETHIHADFLSGARQFSERYGTRIYLSAEGGEAWQSRWVEHPRLNGRPHDVVLVRDGDVFSIGDVELRVLHTPGHTPEHVSYVVTDHGAGATSPLGIATGDFVFVGDLGRPDLLEQAAGLEGEQERSARALFGSLPRFTALEDHVQVWPAHGAGSACGKALGAVPMTTVGYEKRYNAALAAAGRGEDAFVGAILADQPEPPLYFARMKRQNRDGVPPLTELPRPRRLTLEELRAEGIPDQTIVLDTRLDRSLFMRAHLPGSLYAPLDRSFPTVVGSLVEDETAPITLVVDAGRADEAVRDLVRIGHDGVVSFLEPDTLVEYVARGGPADRIEELAFADLDFARTEPGAVVLDVRYASEYETGHVPGAVNASYTRLPDYLETRIPVSGTLLVHCAAGVRSAVASAFLARAGRDVRFVNGSFASWRDAGGRVEAGGAAQADGAAHAGGAAHA